jgi:hypothetical protein
MKTPIGRRELAAAGLILILAGFIRNSHALDLDHGSWGQILKKNVHDGLVDYKGLKANPQELQRYLDDLASLKESEYAPWSREDKIAFWINAYNALTIKAVVDNYPIQPSFPASLRFPKKSIRQIPGVWDELRFVVMSRRMTLNDIEHETLRKKFQEPRVHMALVCASIGCPVLRGEAYTGSNLERQLKEQTRAFLATPSKFRAEPDARHVFLSPIFKWFGQDFVASDLPAQGFEGRAASERAVLNFISRHIDEKTVDFLRNGKYAVKYLDYDWSLNEKGSP